MTPFSGLPQAVSRAKEYERDRIMDETLPQGVLDMLSASTQERNSSNIVANTAEVLYANREYLDNEGKILAAKLIGLCLRYTFHRIGQQSRGMGAMDALKRDMGLECPIGDWPHSEQDPEGDPRFIYVEPPEPPEPIEKENQIPNQEPEDQVGDE